MVLKLVTGNGERGTGVWEQVNNGNPPENSKWKQCLQTLILSLCCHLQCTNKSDDLLLFKYCLSIGEATKPSIPAAGKYF